jgi:hypothetical protein
LDVTSRADGNLKVIQNFCDGSQNQVWYIGDFTPEISQGSLPITDIQLTASTCPTGYEKIEVDLNRLGITFAYLCVTRQKNRSALTGLTVTSGSCPFGYTQGIEFNYSEAKSGLHLCTERATAGSPITKIEATNGLSSDNVCPTDTPVRTDDLNNSSSPDYVYICYGKSNAFN